MDSLVESNLKANSTDSHHGVLQHDAAAITCGTTERKRPLFGALLQILFFFFSAVNVVKQIKCISLEFGHVGSWQPRRLIERALSDAGLERRWIAGDALLLLFSGASFYLVSAFWQRAHRWPDLSFMYSFTFETQVLVLLANEGINGNNSFYFAVVGLHFAVLPETHLFSSLNVEI